MGTVMLTPCADCGEHMPNGTAGHRCPEVVLIFGSRGWADPLAVEGVIDKLPKGSVVIVGGARGADRIAESAARRRSVHVAVVLPLWDRYGGAAGRLRNTAMARLRPSRAVAFWDGASPGTRHMVGECEALGIPVEVVR